jgi:hypothetical protein
VGAHTLIEAIWLRAVDDPSLSQLSTAGLIFVALLFIGLAAAVGIPIWRRNRRRRAEQERARRHARLMVRPTDADTDGQAPSGQTRRPDSS